MPYCKTEGIVLRLHDYGESSQIVTFFTRDYGRLHGIAKGAKRPHKGLPNALDLLNRAEIVFVRKPHGQLHLFTEWVVTENFLRLRQNLDSLYSASYAAELLSDLTEESEESARLYELLLDTLRALAGQEAPLTAVFLFEIRLLGLLGHMPEVKKCVVCGRDLPARARFSPRDGGALCSACPATGTSLREVSSGCLATIAALARTPPPARDRAPTGLARPVPTGMELGAQDSMAMGWNGARRLRIGPAARREIRSLLNACIIELLGREPRMLRFLPSVSS